MDLLAELAGLCRHGLHGLSAQPASLPAALLTAGLAGSLLHCVGMCGPFVLSQVVSDAGLGRRTSYGEWQRLAGAALAPYHLGRLTTYTALGAAGGASTALFAPTPLFASLSGGLLLLAAALMMAQAIGLTLAARAPLDGLVTRLAAPFATASSSGGRYALGLVLGLLPCGLLYGALAAAAGTGSPARGALAMAAFGVGTMPALVGVGTLGLLLRRRLAGVTRWLATPLLVLNAALLLALAAQRLAD